jgi:recombination protein RecA
VAAKKAQADPDQMMTLEELRTMREEISKELGVDLLFGNDERLRLKKMPLGLSSLDRALNGGFAFDRITLLVGEFSAGKTLLAMMAIKAAQKLGLPCAFVDVEKTWTEEWAEQLGIKAADVLVARPRTGEKAFDVALGFVKRRIPVLVMDSLAAMRADAELSSEEDEMFEKQFIGTSAKLIGRGLSSMMAENRGTMIICINQLREKPGVVYGNPETMPGGRAPGFYAWQLVRIRRGAFIEENGRKVGYRLKIVVQKNKQGTPFTEAEVPFYYTGEFDEISALIEVGLELGAIVQDGGHYTVSYTDEGTGEILEERVYGRRRLLELIREDPRAQGALRKAEAALPEVDM